MSSPAPIGDEVPPLDLLAPIPGENPSGVSLRYQPVFDKIKVARREDPDIPGFDWQARKLAEWPKVIKLATNALATESKDLQIAVWLTEAWTRNDGFPGMRRGLELLRGLLDKYWDTLYPELDGEDASMRAALLDWLGGSETTTRSFDMPIRSSFITADKKSFLDYATSRSVPTKAEAEADPKKDVERKDAISHNKITPEDFDASFNATKKDDFRKLVANIQGTLGALTALDELCQSKFSQGAPSFSITRETLESVNETAERLLARKLELDPDPIDTEVVDGVSVPVSGGGGSRAASAALVSIAAGPQSSDDAGQWIAAAARYIRHERPTEPTAYLLLRGYRWGELRTPDRRIDPKMLVAPNTELRSRLKEMLIDGRWPELLNAAEDVLAQPQGRGWLDLQRYALTSSDGLGSDYEPVSTALRGALRSLLADLPSLTSETMMDDSPSANPETMTWLRDEKLLPEGTDTSEIQERPRATTSYRDPYEVALARARAGDASGAMELLMRESAREKSTRARFLRRAQAAEIMVGAGMEPVALPILRELMKQIESFRLEEWEAGDTVAQPLGLLYRCVTKVDGSEIDAHALYDRVCRLDPVRAIQIKAGRGENEGS